MRLKWFGVIIGCETETVKSLVKTKVMQIAELHSQLHAQQGMFSTMFDSIFMCFTGNIIFSFSTSLILWHY